MASHPLNPGKIKISHNRMETSITHHTSRRDITKIHHLFKQNIQGTTISSRQNHTTLIMVGVTDTTMTILKKCIRRTLTLDQSLTIRKLLSPRMRFFIGKINTRGFNNHLLLLSMPLSPIKSLRPRFTISNKQQHSNYLKVCSPQVSYTPSQTF